MTAAWIKRKWLMDYFDWGLRFTIMLLYCNYAKCFLVTVVRSNKYKWNVLMLMITDITALLQLPKRRVRKSSVSLTLLNFCWTLKEKTNTWLTGRKYFSTYSCKSFDIAKRCCFSYHGNEFSWIAVDKLSGIHHLSTHTIWWVKVKGKKQEFVIATV